MDLLQIAGLVNYYGRTPESDNILIKPVLLQKGHTKLALYGMSNVRDERLFRTFRDGKVKFFQPSAQKSEWFNLMSVHQNHHAYTETGYLPENFLPEFLDLVVWGHEHECLIEPRYNPEMSFHVMQPGSSVATSLMPGEAVPKHVAILSVSGKEFKSEPIRLKTVRPFVMKEIVLQDDSHMKRVAMKEDNRAEITRYLIKIVDGLIQDAEDSWRAAQDGEIGDEATIPRPLVRLRVEYTAPEGGRFDCENPQRFSNRFISKVANVNDVIQFYRKKASVARKTKAEPEMPADSVMAQLNIDTVRIEKLVREFLTAQSLTILPQNSFGDAVSQFVDKDDKTAMEHFVNESLANQVKHLKTLDNDDEDVITSAMEEYKAQLEQRFAKGDLKRVRAGKLKPKPDNWDTDIDGEWADQREARIHSEDEAMDEDVEEDAEILATTKKTTSTRGRGRGRGRGGATAGITRATAASTKKAPTKRQTALSRRHPSEEEESEEEDEDVIMIDDDDDDEEDDGLFVKENSKKAHTKTSTRHAASPKRKAPARGTAAKSAAAKQTTLNFSQTPAPSQPRVSGPRSRRAEPVCIDRAFCFVRQAPTDALAER